MVQTQEKFESCYCRRGKKIAPFLYFHSCHARLFFVVVPQQYFWRSRQIIAAIKGHISRHLSRFGECRITRRVFLAMNLRGLCRANAPVDPRFGPPRSSTGQLRRRTASHSEPLAGGNRVRTGDSGDTVAYDQRMRSDASVGPFVQIA